MAIEIEEKAWVDDWRAIEAFLSETCTFVRRFVKSDQYFLYPGQTEPDVGRSTSAFRLRTDGNNAYVTFKQKAVRGPTEINDEREFTVSDPSAFLELTRRVGCSPHFSKVKRGMHFAHGDLTAELVEVEGLGSFLEVEAILESSDPELQTVAARRVRALILAAGISESRLESRPYMQLLRESRSE